LRMGMGAKTRVLLTPEVTIAGHRWGRREPSGTGAKKKGRRRKAAKLKVRKQEIYVVDANCDIKTMDRVKRSTKSQGGEGRSKSQRRGDEGGVCTVQGKSKEHEIYIRGEGPGGTKTVADV